MYIPPRIERWVNVIVNHISYKNTLSQSCLFLLRLWITSLESSNYKQNLTLIKSWWWKWQLDSDVTQPFPRFKSIKWHTLTAPWALWPWPWGLKHAWPDAYRNSSISGNGLHPKIQKGTSKRKNILFFFALRLPVHSSAKPLVSHN